MSETKSSASRERWQAQIDALDAGATATRKDPITIDRIVTTALALVQQEGFDALSMRRVATELGTGPASLYAHVRNKSELDDRMIGRLCASIRVPAPDGRRWRAQIVDVCTQLRDEFLRYPGISRATMVAAPASLETLRLSEGMLTILLAGGVPAQSAAWAIDAAYLYVSAYSLEVSMRAASGGDPDRATDRDEMIERLRMLPADRFPNTVAHADELTAGDGHERFEFTLSTLFRGLG